MSIHAYHSALSPSRADTLMYFPRNRSGFEQIFLLISVLTFNTLGRIKIISFCSLNKMVREPNVSPHKQIIKDDDVKECISIEYKVENQKVSFFTFTIM